MLLAPDAVSLGTVVDSNVLLDVLSDRRSPLPDLYIAAHAAVTGRALLTRDRPRHLELFPSFDVISPT